MHYDSFTNGLSSLKPPLMKTANKVSVNGAQHYEYMSGTTSV